MRLRQRRPRAVAQDWIQPRRAGRWTTIGNLDSSARAAVDPAGLVTVLGASWSLDWWIGAEDRWHLPCREVAVRQSLLGNSPVVETRLRVPSGDAVHRAYAARDRSGAEAVIIEVENASKVPFAVAFAVRPHDQSGIGRVERVQLDGTELRIDGATVVLPKPPGRAALSTAADGDCADVVLGGEAGEIRTGQVACRDGAAQAAVLYPLAHTARVRVVLPLGPVTVVEPGAFPAPDEVAKGWGTQSARGARLELPDRRLRDAVLASGRHLLLAARTPGTAAALDALGFHDEVASWLRGGALELGRTPEPGAALRTVARHWDLTRDPATAADLPGLIGVLVAGLARTTPADRSVGHAALPSIAAALEAAGEDRAAADVRRLVEVEPDACRAGDEDLADLLASATGTWTWPGPGTGHDAEANARLVTLVLGQLVGDQPDALELCPGIPETWLGQGWEVHDLPTRHGRLSCAVRWHGDRPALLWELDAHPGIAPPRLAAPRLDPAWSTAERSGEALLAPVALPERAARRGITMPVTIEPMPKRAR